MESTKQSVLEALANKQLEKKVQATEVREALENGLFVTRSFKIYDSVKGFYDYGPLGCALKSNVLALWRKNISEIDCSCVTPEVVLKASGHVDKFTDLMVKDEINGIPHRADHLLKDFCEKELVTNTDPEKIEELRHLIATLDDLSAQELGVKIKEYNIKAPDTGNPLSDPYPFNLMFH